ncbi:MAG: hypothetical protein IT323_07555 [Anaerolineae bacterium]|nr:hypothetical protein [Anaerolineae bacterium]
MMARTSSLSTSPDPQSEAPPDVTTGKRYPLLVYRQAARRYRPVGVLLFVVGLLAQLPLFIGELRPQNMFITYQQLSLLGLGAIGAGVLLWLAAQYEIRRAFVQCQPDYLLISTASGRVAVAYARFNTLKPVKVSGLYKKEDLKGRDRNILKPLLKETALEALVTDYPLPEKEMRRRLSRYVFSPRDQGFLFIVKKSSDLNMELTAFISRAREVAAGVQAPTGYVGPFERVARR